MCPDPVGVASEGGREEIPSVDGPICPGRTASTLHWEPAGKILPLMRLFGDYFIPIMISVSAICIKGP